MVVRGGLRFVSDLPTLVSLCSDRQICACSLACCSWAGQSCAEPSTQPPPNVALRQSLPNPHRLGPEQDEPCSRQVILLLGPGHFGRRGSLQWLLAGRLGCSVRLSPSSCRR